MAVAISAWAIIAPHVTPIIDDAHKAILKSQGRCPDITITSEAYPYPTKGWFGEAYCNEYIQIEITNKGKNEATNAKVSCILEDPNGFNLAWQEKRINKLQVGEVKPLDMVINYNCIGTFKAHKCTISFEDPCQ